MIKQRLTLFNPGENHDDAVGSIEKEKVVLTPKAGFVLENKLRITPNLEYPLISDVRVQSRRNPYTSDESQVFNYHFGAGLHVYASPLNVTEDMMEDFYQQVDSVLKEWFQLTVPNDSWIRNYNSVYYYGEAIKGKLPIEKELLYNSDIFDWRYTNQEITYKELVPVKSKITITQSENVTKEIGVFLLDRKLTTIDDLALSGLRIAMNEEDEEFVFRTLFHVKPRHRLTGTVTSNLVENGLHPIIRSSLKNTVDEQIEDTSKDSCKLYYYINLDKLFIFDKYQSIPAGGVLVVSNGNSDLELPAYKVAEWGNEILFEFDQEVENIDFTVHSRYQEPGSTGKYLNLPPQVFRACDGTKDYYLLLTSPFDNNLRIGGNYETYFTNDTVFYHYVDEGSSIGVNIPSGKSNFERVERITGIALLLGVIYILYKLVGGPKRAKQKVA